ncbi:MAG: hypothetical protein GWN00_02875, partial [Aliifodinibius sp.]|nr:tetratricopeptide repeat protein [Fodinibius sp.]NIY23798.1 hypothetical protein [Fodinibius sp.]
MSEALRNLVEAKNAFIHLNDEESQMKTLMFTACVYRSMGDYDQSYLDLQRCIEFFHKSKNTTWEALSLLSLAMTCEQIGDYKGMRRYNQQIVKLVTEPELQWMVGRALDGIGTIYLN